MLGVGYDKIRVAQNDESDTWQHNDYRRIFFLFEPIGFFPIFYSLDNFHIII